MLLDMYGDQSAINSLRQLQSKTCSSKEEYITILTHTYLGADPHYDAAPRADMPTQQTRDTE